MNVIRFYSTLAAIFFLSTVTLVCLDLWKWALIPVCAAFGLMAMGIAALINQQMITASLLQSQLNALMAFFQQNGVKVEGQEGG
jgi:hypothetical protein